MRAFANQIKCIDPTSEIFWVRFCEMMSLQVLLVYYLGQFCYQPASWIGQLWRNHLKCGMLLNFGDNISEGFIQMAEETIAYKGFYQLHSSTRLQDIQKGHVRVNLLLFCRFSDNNEMSIFHVRFIQIVLEDGQCMQCQKLCLLFYRIISTFYIDYFVLQSTSVDSFQLCFSLLEAQHYN